MAIYSFNVGFSAYISASRHVDERTGVLHSFVNKENVTDSWIIAPLGAPDWALHPSTLWNKVEAFEDHIANLRFRGDSFNPEKHLKSERAKEAFLNSTRTAQTVMGALPLELTKEQNRALVDEFVRTCFTPRGLVVQCAIHWDKGNPHFHGLVTRRPLVNGEFSPRKDHGIVTKPELFILRRQFEVITNKNLALAGREERNSYLQVKAYQEAASTAASLFHLIKNGTSEKEGPQSGQSWSKETWPRETLQHLFQEKCEVRDMLALQISQNPTNTNPSSKNSPSGKTSFSSTPHSGKSEKKLLFTLLKKT